MADEEVNEMDWKKEAADILRKYGHLRFSLDNIKERIRLLDKTLTQLSKTDLSERIWYQGKDTSVSDVRLSLLVSKAELKKVYDRTLKQVRQMEKVVEGLDENELKTLTRFYIEPTEGGVEQLMEELGCEKSKLYRIKDKALVSFVKGLYDIKE